MISLEQVQLLETKVGRAIEIVQRLSAENASLAREKNNLLSKLEANQKRLDELEVLVMRFKEDQGRIEDGIMAALDRLSQFEEAFESGLKDNTVSKKSTPKKSHSSDASSSNTGGKKTESAKGKEFFEITEAEKEDAQEADLSEDFSLDENEEDEEYEEDDDSEKGKKNADGELDIF